MVQNYLLSTNLDIFKKDQTWPLELVPLLQDWNIQQTALLRWWENPAKGFLNLVCLYVLHWINKSSNILYQLLLGSLAIYLYMKS